MECNSYAGRPVLAVTHLEFSILMLHLTGHSQEFNKWLEIKATRNHRGMPELTPSMQKKYDVFMDRSCLKVLFNHESKEWIRKVDRVSEQILRKSGIAVELDLSDIDQL